MRLIVLAAGEGARLRPLTEDRTQALVPFLGRPLLEWTLAAARDCAVEDVTVIGGHRSDRLAEYPVHLMRNPEYATTSMVASLMVADPVFGDAFVMSCGDIVYRPEVLRAVLASTAEIGVVVDLDWREYWERRFGDPLSDAGSLRMTPEGNIRSIGQEVLRIEDVQAQYIGVVVFRGRGVKALRRAWVRAKADAAYHRPVLGYCNAIARLAMTDVLDELTAGDVPIKAIPIHGGWVEIDTPEDLVAAEERWNSRSPSIPIAAEKATAAPATGSGAGSAPGAAAGLGTAPEWGPIVLGQPTIHRLRRW